jgi:hypothetical protein
MGHLSSVNEIDKFIIALAPDKLSEWNIGDIRKLVVGLLTQLELSYPYGAEIKLNLLDELVGTCKALRLFLDRSSFSRDEQVQINLSKIISRLNSLFLSNYRITSYEIEELYFNEQASELLHDLNIISSIYSVRNGYYGMSSEDIQKQKDERRRRLLEFATQNIEGVIKTAYNWGRNGGGHNCHITPDQRTRIRIFEALNDGIL